MLNIQPTKEEEHAAKLLTRIRIAKELGQVKKLRYWTGVYFNSFDARLAAVQRANRRRKLKNRLDTATVLKVAAGLDARQGTDEPVLVHRKRKTSNPDSFRTYMAFGIENKALQYLVLRLLEQVAVIPPYQYSVMGGGTHAAIKHAVKAMSTGPVWAVEVDVVDCYPSFEGKKLKDQLLIPKEVTENVLISEHLNLKGGNLAGITKLGPFGPAGDPKASMTLEGMLAAARQGIPQGSAVSPFIAETMLAIALREVPKLGDIVAYGDNCLLLAKEESDMVTMIEALESALEAHPVGLLTPKRRLFKLGAPVEFLGHRLIPHGSKIRVEPSQKCQNEFERSIRRQVAHLKYEKKLSAAERLRARRKAEQYVQGWAANFCLCDGIGQCEAYWLMRVANASAPPKK
jgi:Reverse transcriptase (RNA-dependent DNA polymerase)